MKIFSFIKMGNIQYEYHLSNLLYISPTHKQLCERINECYIFKLNGIECIELRAFPITDTTIIYSHGAGSNIYSDKGKRGVCFNVNLFNNLRNKLKCNFISYDYPAFGNSEGICCEENCIETLNYV